MDDYSKKQNKTKITSIILLILSAIVIGTFIILGNKIETSYNERKNNDTHITTSITEMNTDIYDNQSYKCKFDYFSAEFYKGKYKIYNDKSTFEGTYQIKDNKLICFFKTHKIENNLEYTAEECEGFVFDIENNTELVFNSGVSKDEFNKLIF